VISLKEGCRCLEEIGPTPKPGAEPREREREPDRDRGRAGGRGREREREDSMLFPPAPHHHLPSEVCPTMPIPTQWPPNVNNL
jgi:hypothetical protein